MKNKNLFFKVKKNSILIKILPITIILISISYYLYFIYNNNSYFILNPKNHVFYIIPDNIEGKKIPDFGISILENYQFSEKNDNSIIIDSKYKFSIQLFSSSNLELSIYEMNRYIKEFNIKHKDLNILEFQTNLGKSYLLLYKLYIDKKDALNDCKKRIFTNIKCLLVNLENL